MEESVWEQANQYCAKLGGVIYRNVPQPVTMNGEAVISLHRHSETGLLAPSFELYKQDGASIASIEYGELILHCEDEFVCISAVSRFAVLERASGRVWCDVRYAPWPEYELDCAVILFSTSGYPILLHPDRSKFGTANENNPPNISGLTLTTAPASDAGAIAVDHSSLYLLDAAIENFRTGVAITYEPDAK